MDAPNTKDAAESPRPHPTSEDLEVSSYLEAATGEERESLIPDPSPEARERGESTMAREFLRTSGKRGAC